MTSLRAELGRALADDEFAVHYQPIYDLASGWIIAVEALARWLHPERGILAPAEFIPAAEASGLIGSLGRRVLEIACRDMARARVSSYRTGGVGLSVNVAPAQLVTGYPDQVAAVLAETGLPPTDLILEITETAALADEVGPTLRRLSSMGIRLALDDFGTGSSSLRSLGRHPIDILKLDRSFVVGLGRSPRAGTMVDTIMDLGRRINVRTIAEGIEEGRQLERLRASGCDAGQGYLLGRPLRVPALKHLLASGARLGSAAALVNAPAAA